jgi:antitoxin VapB
MLDACPSYIPNVYTNMTRTKLFRNNRTQAVRLPKEVAFTEKVSEVIVFKEGNRRVIVPADTAWDDFFDRPPVNFPDREQPAVQTRSEL